DNLRQRENASTLLLDPAPTANTEAPEPAIHTLRRVLEHYPGALLAATQHGPHSTVAVTSDGMTITATAVSENKALPAGIGAAVIRECALRPGIVDHLIQVSAGTSEWLVHLTVNCHNVNDHW
ncbi:MAG: hypothetical protein JWP75_2110, partial [Frondihabitans sp.]|nr:hypothetical protein [Frondihabitans sp.]